jgi:hypothetical protein
MQIPVLVEPVAAAGFRARSGEPLPLSAEGTTREEALSKLKELLNKQMQNGAELTTLEVGVCEHPLAGIIGMWSPDDPVIAEWQQAIEEYRQKIDEEDAAR